MEQFKVDTSNEDKVNKNGLCHMSLEEWTSYDKTTLASQLSIFGVDDECAIDSIIRPPNADDDDVASVLRMANKGLSFPARAVPWGRLVSVGQIMVIWNNGSVCLVGPGRWNIKFNHKCFSSWGQRLNLTEDLLSVGPFTMVRVRRGKLGLAVENGRPVLLKEGLHVYNNPLFIFKEFKGVDATHVQHMSYHVVRVPRGSFGKITEQARAKLLPEGTHTVNNAVFEFSGLVQTIDAYINHGTLHIIQVPKGSVGLVSESKRPQLLSEGVHIYDSATLNFEGIRSKMEPQIIHGTISRFRVQKGEVGLAWLDNEPVLIEEPGTYLVDSPSFRFVALKQANDKTIVLGAKKIVTVNAGEVAVTFKGGKLVVLPPGRHYIKEIDHIFDGFLSTQQLSLKLAPQGRRGADEGILTCETKDLVDIGIRADVFYRISNPEQAIMEVGREFIPELVKETSVATLNNIIRSTALGEIAQSNEPSAVSQKDHDAQVAAAQALGQSSAPLFFDKAHDLFLAKLHDDFKERYGLEITNIRIEQFKILDQALSKSIGGQAIKTAETQSQLANLEGQTRIATQQQEREVRLQQLQAEADAKRAQVQADSKKAQAEALAAAQQVKSEMEASTRRIAAEAEADAVRTQAQAAADAARIQAEALVSQAKAEAEAITLKAKAEADRAKLLAATPLGERMTLLEIYGDVVKKSNEGVNKVVYVDPTTTQAGNPLALLTLQSLQKDLAQLGGGAKVDSA